MSLNEIPASLAVFRLATGYYYSCALYVAAKLGVADLIAQGRGGYEELADATETCAPALRRVLRLLVTAGVFTEDAAGNLSLTELGECLRAGGSESMHAAVLLWGGPTQDAWGGLLTCVRTGQPAFGPDTFGRIEKDPEFAAIFDAAMAAATKRTAVAVAAMYDFSQVRTVVDIGGGNGALMAGILQANPHLHGIVFDRPQVIERARLPERCEGVAGDFFKTVPDGGDVYLLKHVIHDWNDEKAAAILQTCRRAMRGASRLLVIEGLYPERLDTSDGCRGALSNDVNMLVCTGGRQRSEEEFRSLFHAAGLELKRIIPTPARVAIIEAVCA